MTRGDLTKLPKWAQREITALEGSLAHERARLSAGPEDSDTFVDPYAEAPRPLGKGPLVEYRLGTLRDERIHVRLNEYGDVEVRGTRGIVLTPHASNVVLVRIDPR